MAGPQSEINGVDFSKAPNTGILLGLLQKGDEKALRSLNNLLNRPSDMQGIAKEMKDNLTVEQYNVVQEVLRTAKRGPALFVANAIDDDLIKPIKNDIENKFKLSKDNQKILESQKPSVISEGQKKSTNIEYSASPKQAEHAASMRKSMMSRMSNMVGKAASAVFGKSLNKDKSQGQGR